MVPELKETVQALCPEVNGRAIQDFFSHMGEEYLAAFTPAEIAAHIQMATSLGEKQRVKVRFAAAGDGEFDITIVGFDYLSQFSIFCGLLSAFALDIRTGDIYSFRRHSLSSRVVDVFRVALKRGESFDESKQREFESELQTLACLLAKGSTDEARERLNRFLTERIERMNASLTGLLSPVSLTFDNQISPEWTMMEVRSEDTFAFLYAVSNALSLRGINISRVKIRSSGNETRDQFFMVNRLGQKIKEGADQERLSHAVGMLKQFTHFLPDAPDPGRAMRHFDQFLDKIVEFGEENFPDKTISHLASPEGMRTLAHLLGSSDFLWNDFLRIHFTELLPLLENVDEVGVSEKAELERGLEASLDHVISGDATETKAALNAFKDRQLFLIDVKHLLAPNATLFDFSLALTALAEVVIAEAAQFCYTQLAATQGEPRRENGTICPFAICALGKFGGREMGYASDLELMFVHEGAEGGVFYEALAHQVVDFIEARDRGIFHIDLRLRPHGDAGTWSTSYEQFTKYYTVGGDAQPFERQALTKLRWIAGDRNLGQRIEAHRDSFTYGGAPWDWENALQLRRRQMQELVKPGQTNVKYSAGGIIDIEYAVQYLQILNGKEHPQIRVPTTLAALAQLRRLQIVREADYKLLYSSYLFLRNLIDAMRIVRGDAKDLVLPAETSDDFKALARRLGYRERERSEAASHLAADIQESMQRAHTYFVARFDTFSAS